MSDQRLPYVYAIKPRWRRAEPAATATRPECGGLGYYQCIACKRTFSETNVYSDERITCRMCAEDAVIWYYWPSAAAARYRINTLASVWGRRKPSDPD